MLSGVWQCRSKPPGWFLLEDKSTAERENRVLQLNGQGMRSERPTFACIKTGQVLSNSSRFNMQEFVRCSQQVHDCCTAKQQSTKKLEICGDQETGLLCRARLRDLCKCVLSRFRFPGSTSTNSFRDSQASRQIDVAHPEFPRVYIS